MTRLQIKVEEFQKLEHQYRVALAIFSDDQEIKMLDNLKNNIMCSYIKYVKGGAHYE